MALDAAIIRALPSNCEIISVGRHGKTNWASGLKVKVKLNGEEHAYFLKVTERENASLMARGEFESQAAMKKAIPRNSAQPLAWGPLDGHPSRAFYMCEFHDLEDHTARLYSRSAEPDEPGSPAKLLGGATLRQAHLDIEKPSPPVVVSILARLHRDSVSPTGMFGFPVLTYKGLAPMDNEWCGRWEDWFARQLRLDVQFEQSVRGPDPEMDGLLDEFVARVIPRLLRPLQTGGRSIKPSLVHTDIWHGNIHRDRVSREPIVFDACCVYGHHEMELGMFREQQYGWNPEYLQEYLSEMPPSEPRADFDDRNAIYAMRNYIVTAGLWQHRAYLRELVKEEMRRLLEKHPDGIDGFVEAESEAP